MNDNLQENGKAAKVVGKKFLYFDTWEEWFGYDRATGDATVGFEEAPNDLHDDEVLVDDDIPLDSQPVDETNVEDEQTESYHVDLGAIKQDEDEISSKFKVSQSINDAFEDIYLSTPTKMMFHNYLPCTLLVQILCLIKMLGETSFREDKI